MLAHHSCAVTDVLTKIVKPGNAALVAAFFFQYRHIAECSPGSTTGLCRVHSGFEIFLLELFQMKAKLLVQLVIQSVALKERAQTLPDNVKESSGHLVSDYARLSSNPTAEESRRQFSNSSSSCFLPSRVNA